MGDDLKGHLPEGTTRSAKCSHLVEEGLRPTALTGAPVCLYQGFRAWSRPRIRRKANDSYRT